jgi:hypothetical protein
MPEPFSFEPMLCESAERPPEGPEWRYELKLDGFRAIARKSGRSAQLWSRNQKDFTRRFQRVVKGIAELPPNAIDGSAQPFPDDLSSHGSAWPPSIMFRLSAVQARTTSPREASVCRSLACSQLSYHPARRLAVRWSVKAAHAAAKTR